MYPIILGYSFLVVGGEHEVDPGVKTAFTSSTMGTIIPGEKRTREYAGHSNEQEEEPRIWIRYLISPRN